MRKKTPAPPPPHAGCDHTAEEHAAIFRKIMSGKEDGLKPEPGFEPLVLPLRVEGRPMRGLDAWH